MSLPEECAAVLERASDRMFIGGAWVGACGGERVEVVNPATEQVLGAVACGTAADVESAVRTAQRALEPWSARPLAERVALMLAVAGRLGELAEQVATCITAEVGTPIGFSRMLQAGLPQLTFASMADLAPQIAWEEQIGNSLVVREAVGVVGAITPWNYPLHQVAAKVAPALTAGCTVVLKPSEVAPTTALLLAEVCHEVGVPAGVLNVVTGLGAEAGEALASHPAVDMVSFTGSSRAGRRVAGLAAQTVKRVGLELGGKSANVILDDADMEQAVANGVAKCYLNGGQSCNALSRMLVPAAQVDTAAELAVAAAETYVCGDPFAETTALGPMASATQRTRVRGFIDEAVQDGARLVTGGAESPEGLSTGYFVRPTVFSHVSNDTRIAREEVFGPVLSIIGYADEDEAVAIANDTVYGLAGGVWSADKERALGVARRLRTGQVEVNGGDFNPLAPFGGFKQSGNGRELGRYGLEEYVETKAVQL